MGVYLISDAWSVIRWKSIGMFKKIRLLECNCIEPINDGGLMIYQGFTTKRLSQSMSWDIRSKRQNKRDDKTVFFSRRSDGFALRIDVHLNIRIYHSCPRFDGHLLGYFLFK